MFSIYLPIDRPNVVYTVRAFCGKQWTVYKGQGCFIERLWQRTC